MTWAVPGARAQVPGEVEWYDEFASQGSTWEEGVAIATDGSDVYVAGLVRGTLVGQDVEGSGPVFLRKYDAAGNEQWSRQFGLYQSDPTGVALDATGVYVVGYTHGTFPGQSPAGGRDGFLIKFDFDGNEIWTRQFGTSGDDFALDVATYDAGVYITGFVGYPAPWPDHFDGFVQTYDGLGNPGWYTQFTSIDALPGNSYFNDDDFAHGIAVNSTGIFVVGDTRGEFAPGAWAGGGDAFVQKLTHGGSLSWVRQFGSPDTDWGRGAAADETGVYIAGRADAALPGQTFAGHQDAYIRKYDNLGNHVWTDQFGTATQEIALDAAADGGRVYVTGWTYGELTGNPSASGPDAFVRGYDATTGSLEWTDQFLGIEGSQVEGAGVTAEAGFVYVAGKIRGEFPGQTSLGNYDVYVRGYAPAGTELWTRQFGGVGDAADYASDAAALGGEVYVIGVTEGNLLGLPNATTGGRQGFVRKYAADGTVVWTRQFGLPDTARPYGVAVDVTGVYVVGNAGGSAFVRKYDPEGIENWTTIFGTGATALDVAADGAGWVYVSGQTWDPLPGQTGAGRSDAFVRKYDAYGGEVWTRQFGSAQNDSGTSISTNGTHVYVAGQADGSLPGQTHAGGADAYVRKYTADGRKVWTRQFGSSSYDRATGVSSDGTDVYVGGRANGLLPGVDPPLPGRVFLRKYSGAGSELWTRQFTVREGASTWDVENVNDVAADSTGARVVGSSALEFGAANAYVSKFDPGGDVLWTTFVGPTGSWSGGPSAYGVALDDGNAYVAGRDGGGDAFAAKLSGVPPTGTGQSGADILSGSGVPGKGLDHAPGLQKPFNEKSAAADNAGMKK